MDHYYSTPKRIWRILYPPLVFLAVQVVVVFISFMFIGAFFTITEISAGMDPVDTAGMIERARVIAADNALLFVLISDIVGLAFFLPMWKGTRKYNAKYSGVNLKIIILLVFGFFAAFNLVQMVIFGLTNVVDYFPAYQESAAMVVKDSFLVQLLLIGFAAPIVEEIIFRGIMLNRMKWLPLWPAILIQAVLFGIVHLNLFQGLYACVAGILLGLVYIKFRSLIAVIAGHMAFNLASLLLSTFATETATGIAVIVSIIVLPVCAILLIAQRKAVAIQTEQVLTPPIGYPRQYGYPLPAGYGYASQYGYPYRYGYPQPAGYGYPQQYGYPYRYGYPQPYGYGYPQQYGYPYQYGYPQPYGYGYPRQHEYPQQYLQSTQEKQDIAEDTDKNQQ